MIPTMVKLQTPRSAYIHVPFCRHRCGYCNFTLVAGRDDLFDSYLDAIRREMELLETPREVETVFVGGGTPSHLPADELRRLLELIQQWFPLAPEHEMTVEVNPVDVGLEKFKLMAQFGVTRLSIGAQSFDDSKLRLLERDHREDHIRRAVELSRDYFASVSLDLIFGVPHESLDTWHTDLEKALSLKPDHLSTYGLTFERGTSFGSRLRHGELQPVDEELEREMYLTAIDSLTSAGLEHYEVSNFARQGHRCRHNEACWLGRTYFAVGPGAARFVDGRREMNHRSTTTYLRRMREGQSPIAESEQLAPKAAALERLVFGLRRLEGVDCDQFLHETGFDPREMAGTVLEDFVKLGMLQWCGATIKLTREGLLVSDSIWPKLLIL